ncbi:MAG: hypothetical protein QXM31_03425 [Candidatus Woesearchaeota archaeon]
MRKTIIAVLLAAMLLVEASAVLAGVSPYVEPLSMTSEGGGAYGGVARTASTTGVIRRIEIAPKPPCNLDITTSPDNLYFLTLARTECATKNKGNLFCQQQCLDKMKMMTYSNIGSKKFGLYGAYGCSDADLAAVKAVKSVTKCYYVAKEECAKTNPTNDYCRRKCVQNTYALCRQNVAQLRFTDRP